MNDRNAFDRQLAREIENLAGPEPRFDPSEVVSKASRPARRRRFPSPFGTVQLAAAAAVVALFAGFLVFSGLLSPSEDPNEASVGASPSASAQPAPTADAADAFPPVKISHATGTFSDVLEGPEVDDLWEDTPNPLRAQGFDVDIGEPLRYAVTSSDPRLAGEAIEITVGGFWRHETTVDDIDRVEPDGPWHVSTEHGRLEIRNENGSWSGTTGSAFWARGTEPADGVPDNAPGFERIGPTILAGSGDYEGLTAFIEFALGPGRREGDTFEAIIVNREIPGALSERLWQETMQEAGMAE